MAKNKEPEKSPSKGAESIAQWLDEWERRRGKAQKELEQMKARFASLPTVEEEINKVLESDGIDIEKGTNSFMKFMFGDENAIETGLKKLDSQFERRKSIMDKYKDDPEKQSKALYLFDNNPQNQSEKSDETDDDGLVGDLVGGAQKQLSKDLSTMLTDFDNFGKNFEQMGKNLANKMLQTAADALMQQIFNEKTAAIAIKAIRALWDIGGMALGFGGDLAKSTGKLFVNAFGSKKHSGGVIPSGASYSLPGTQEQLALLKGGERVLSPGENTQYQNGQGMPPIVVNKFDVKAWDSKDVSKYLLENKQLLNSITCEGIKNNNQMLRHMVRNA